MVAKRPGLMDQTWTSFTSELMPDAWLGTLTFVVLAPPFLTFCARYSPFETQHITLKDAYILAIGAFAIQGKKNPDADLYQHEYPRKEMIKVGLLLLLPTYNKGANSVFRG